MVYQIVTQKKGLHGWSERLFDLFKSFVQIESSHKSDFFQKKTLFIHTCATCFELHSNISIIIQEIVTCFITLIYSTKLVTTSWTDGTFILSTLPAYLVHFRLLHKPLLRVKCRSKWIRIHLDPWIRIQRYRMEGKAEFSQKKVFVFLQEISTTIFPIES